MIMPVNDVTKLRRLENNLFDPKFPEWRKKEVYAKILSLVTKKWQDRVKQLEDEINQTTR